MNKTDKVPFLIVLIRQCGRSYVYNNNKTWRENRKEKIRVRLYQGYRKPSLIGNLRSILRKSARQMDIWGEEPSWSAKVLSVLGVLRNSEIFSVTDGEKATRKELGDDIRKVGKSPHVGSWRPWRGLCVLF